MIKQIRTSKFSKVVAAYLALMIFVEMTQPIMMYALTSGPTQPEFNSFTPIATSDMVSLTSGDFNYNIPIMDVGGYPLNLSYSSNVTMDQEASWTGLGWNLNVGQIERQVRGLPDDFRGDVMRYENDVKDNITIGTHFNFHPAILGTDLKFVSIGTGVQYNNYEGITFKQTYGISYGLADNVSIGANFSSSVGEGASVSPSVTLSGQMTNKQGSATDVIDGSGALGLSFDSRKGLSNLNISATIKNNVSKIDENTCDVTNEKYEGSKGGSISLNNSMTYTPTKRVGYTNHSYTFNASLGTEIFGPEAQGQISGYGSYQGISSAYKDRLVKAFGYENTQYKLAQEGVLDFNREKEQTVSKNTNALPITNYTYDTYSIEGQGISGMFRPYRSQVTNVYNDNVYDHGNGGSFGVELGGGNLTHTGVDFNTSPSSSSTGKWINNNHVLPYFEENYLDSNNLRYEPVAFKLVGELNVDKENTIYENQMYGSKAWRFAIDKKKYNNSIIPLLAVKESLNPFDYSSQLLTSKIKRTQRNQRNQLVQKITALEAVGDPFIKTNVNAQPHHTAGIKVLKADGSTYVYGQAVYNIKKVEATFDVSGKSATAGTAQTGILSNITGVAGHNSNKSDKFINKITTPAYAHTFLISSVLSSDYEDIDVTPGPSVNDLGTYTKFEYTTEENPIKWRVPYKSTDVSYNEGLKSNTDDEKGSYVYGEKQLTYLKRIITKTHVAIFTLSPREDAKGAKAENFEAGVAASTFKITKISLYSLPEAKAAKLLDNIATNDEACSPIKTAHFEYTYDLCKGTPNGTGTAGKLTLKQLYFTYRDSNMGRYTPYLFTYSDFNPDYDIKGFDIWGNYKENKLAILGANPNNTLSNSEFPFTQQDIDTAKENSSAWILKSVKLPSGGEITISTESDDYQYVQNKKAMQMFKVMGCGDGTAAGLNNTTLYNGGLHAKYLYVDLGAEKDPVTQERNPTTTVAEFKKRYLSQQENKPVYFRFLLNMTDEAWQKDYVSGYFYVDGNVQILPQTGTTYAAIPMKSLNMEGGISGGSDVNPISKAGWGFGRMYLNRIVYSMGGDSSNDNFKSIVMDLIGSITSISELWTGPNKALQDKGCARTFDSKKSWIRLENPSGHKLGGGLRVKSVALSDNWDVMTANVYDNIYKQHYGQVYSYNLPNNKSSGVATFEPNSSAENPFVEPFYPNSGNYADRIAAPKDQNYVEKPFGEAFFPAPVVTYSRVTVKNLPRAEGTKKVTKHATGYTVTENYTSYDFPTLVDYTNADITYNPPNAFTSFLNIRSITHLAVSQGFAIENNDMNGKMKSQKIYAEGDIDPISEVSYNYNTDANQKLDNKITTIDNKGIVKKHLLGVECDIITDFNESKSKLETMGSDTNLASMLVALFPLFVPVPFPKYCNHETNLRTAVVTKVVHKTGILMETVAVDNHSRVATKNLAWDANTGQVLLTKTTNEFEDSYYNFTYPAYWYYKTMGLASENIDLSGTLKPINIEAGIPYLTIDNTEVTNNIDQYFKIGDELFVTSINGPKLWVYGYNSTNTGVQLMKSNGAIVTTNLNGIKFRVTRSGNRNMQMAPMASVTTMINPIDPDNNPATENNLYSTLFTYDNTASNPQRRDGKVVNASAIEYSDDWPSQCENKLPNENRYIDEIGPVNPFRYNIRGDWRAIKSYAYLTGRNNFVTDNRRKAGFFMSFVPFYVLDTTKVWLANRNNWTNASEVTKYNPFGVELENMDALKRYSSAQYGYNYTLPVAVTSNAQYKEIGFDGFEDYSSYLIPSLLKPHFAFSQSIGDEENAFVTKAKSHTGQHSIAVNPGKKAVFTRKIDGCKVSGELGSKNAGTPTGQRNKNQKNKK